MRQQRDRGVHGACDTAKVHLTRLAVDRNGMHLDVEVCRRFIESGMGRDWHDPVCNER